MDNTSSVVTPQISIDPEFADADVDIVLISSDNVGFKIHSYVLKTTSSIFADMLSLPRANEESGKIDVTEPSTALRPLLRLVTSKGIPTDLDGSESILVLADKYDMKGVASIVNQMIMASSEKLMKANPLRLYAIACRFNIRPLKGEVFRFLLDVDIQSEEYRKSMGQLNAGDLAELTEKRRALRDVVDAQLSSLLMIHERPASLHWVFTCADHPQNHPQLPENLARFIIGLRAAVYRELDRRPSGSGLLQAGFVESHFHTLPPDPLVFCQAYHPSGPLPSITRKDMVQEIYNYLLVFVNATELEMR